MGALVAFELARELRRCGSPMPQHLFLAARAAPQLVRAERHTYTLSDAAFVDELRRLNGTPPEVFSHAELLQEMLPFVRADFELCETYTYTPGPPLQCPISAFGGAADPDVSPPAIDAWRRQTSSQFRARTFAGGHFFFRSAERLLIDEVSRDLDVLLASITAC
jgi:surfactin synthase thioesterase subunit